MPIMDAKQIQTIAREVVTRTRTHYTPQVWDYVNRETRKGWVARAVVVDFAVAAPGSTARDVAAVVKACDEIVDAG